MDMIVSVQKSIMLKADQYGHWKVRMKQLIREINEDAWRDVDTGWEDPTIVTAEGTKPRPMEGLEC